MLNANNPARLIFLTNRVGRQLARYCLPQMELEGFSPQPTHLGILADLTVRDGQRQQDLAVSGIIDKATVTRSIAQLLELGYITRVKDTVDRRQKIITITDKGRLMWKNTEEHMSDIMPEVTSGISQKKLNVCMEVLAEIYQTMAEKVGGTPEIKEHA